MTYQDMSPKGLVELVCGVRWEDLTIEQAKAVDHALRHYQQTIYLLDAGLEEKIQRIVMSGVRSRRVVLAEMAARVLPWR